MKVHYINTLLFALPLSILVNTHKNPSNTTHHTPTNRSLCECELYAPANYDSDPQMKSVMENFNKQTQQRFHEYDDRMVEKRRHCKVKCDKEIQKIILKDKLEKQMEQQLTTLETKIGTDDIPTCVCETSVADKVEKRCLQCGSLLGGTLPELGLMGGTALYTLNQWSITATNAAIVAAKELAITEATNAGVKTVVSEIKALFTTWGKGALDLSPIVSKSNFKYPNVLLERAKELFGKSCIIDESKNITSTFCNSYIYYGGEDTFNHIAQVGATTYETTLKTETATLTEAKVGAVEATYGAYHISIIASIVAIVIIVLIMLIIYLILRYRRKKKMKKKLQYIKLLEE